MPESFPQSPAPQRLKILLTEGSSISARQMLYDLGPHHTIDILDPDALCQCRFSRFVRRWYRSPSFSADPCGFLNCLGERLRTGEYDVLLPPHDEVFLLSRVREALTKRVAVAIPEVAAVELLQSKLQFLTIAREIELPHPQTHVIVDQHELEAWNDFPRFVKLDYGTAGQTVRLARDRGELNAALAAFREQGWWAEGTPILLQQPASGTQGFVRGLYRRGKLVASHASALRLRGVGGSAVARESVDHPVVTEHMRRLGERLNWHGVLFADYFYDEASQTPYYIEANPRIGDSANATFSGAHICQQWVDVAMGRELRQTTPPLQGVRSHSAILILMSRAMDGASRRDLWREMLKQQHGADIYENSQDELTRVGDDWLSALPYFWVATRLLAQPAAAQKMVRSTVANYALTATAAQRIRELPSEQLVACFEGKDWVARPESAKGVV